MINFAPRGKFLWDLWFIKDKGQHHVFYLQAKRTKDSEKRHGAKVSIGHAVSKDLKRWKELPVALNPGRKGSWDDLALWTGSVIKNGPNYYMFYTGRKNKKNLKYIQKIGLATSSDLINWKKSGNNPILEADKKYYEMRNDKNKIGKVGAWRDPYVFKDPKSKKYFMTITARKKGRKREYNGCIALAESKDLINWKILPPILSPARYDEMETSQVIYHKGFYYLFFGVGWVGLYEPSWQRRVGIHTGLHCYYSRNLKGPYKPTNNNGVVVEHAEKIYDIRLLKAKGDSYTGIGWLNHSKDEKFIGKMSLPFTIDIYGDKIDLKYNLISKVFKVEERK